MRMVITKEFGNYIVTDEKNYNAYIRDVRAVQKLKENEWTVDEIIDYYCKYCKMQKSDFIIKVK